MSSITIQTKDGNKISQEITPGGNISSCFEYNDPNFTDISITLDTPGTYRLTCQLLAKCNFSLIATVPNVIISAGTAGEVFSTITTHDEYDESIIKVIETPGTTVKAIIKNITFEFIGTKVYRDHKIWTTPGSQAGYYYLKFQDKSQSFPFKIYKVFTNSRSAPLIRCKNSNRSALFCTRL